MWVSNTASTYLYATGYWTTTSSAPPSPGYCVTSVPHGVVAPSCTSSPNTMPSGLHWTNVSGSNPPQVEITADSTAVQGTYTFSVNGTIGQAVVPASPGLTLVVTACQAISCAEADTACGSIDNGCGATVTCPGCPSGKSCIGGSCYSCPEEYCAPPKFWNPSICACESCPCGTIISGGKPLCNVCKP